MRDTCKAPGKEVRREGNNQENPLRTRGPSPRPALNDNECAGDQHQKQGNSEPIRVAPHVRLHGHQEDKRPRPRN